MTKINFKGAPDHPKSTGKSMGGRSVQKMGSTMDNRAKVIGSGIKGPSATVYGSGMKEANVYPGGTEARTDARSPISGSKGIVDDKDE